MRTGYFLALSIVLLAVVGIIVSPSYAVEKKNIVAAWLFDDGSGKTVKDASGNQHDGEIKGGITWANGKFDRALLFPGNADGYVSIPHKDSLNLATWSITAWVKLEKSSAWPAIVVKNDNQTRNYSIWENGADGSIIVQQTKGGPNQFQQITGGVLLMVNGIMLPGRMT